LSSQRSSPWPFSRFQVTTSNSLPVMPLASCAARCPRLFRALQV
jgi:hypothetical protein